MAGSKTAAKKKKPSAADSQELKRVQAWVADGLQVTDVSALVTFVGQNCQGTSPRLQLLGSLYLLLKKWPSTVKDVTPELLNQLEELQSKASKELEPSASGQKPALVWGWAALVALGKLGAAASGEIQKQLFGKVVATLQPTLKVTDPQGWLDQWQLPQEFPAAAEQGAAAGNPQQLAAALGYELLRAYVEALMRTGQFNQTKGPQAIANALKELAEGKEAPKADAKSTKDKAAAGKKEDKSKDKKDAAAAKQATVMQLQRETSPKQPQQQKRTKDTDRVKDAALRGTAGDDKAAQELAAHKELVAKAQEKADEVLKYLSETTLGANFSQQEHISALQSQVAIKSEEAVLKTYISNLRRHDPSASSSKDVKKGEVKGDVYEEKQAKDILKLYRDQFGNTAGEQEAGKSLLSQLEQAVEKGVWLVYTEGEEGPKSGKDKAYYSSLGEFLQHVQKEYLDGKLAQADLDTYGMVCRDIGPGLLDAYKMDFGDKLADEAARALRRTKKAGSDQANGCYLQQNAWMQAFSEDCPLRRYLLHSNRTPLLSVADDVLPSVTTLPELSLDKMAATSRPHVAAGFALLQLQRNQIVVGVEDLSTAPDWQVKAYQCLKVLLPMMNSNVMPDHLDFVIFHYFSEVEQPEPTQDLREMLDPDLYPAAQAAAGSAGQPGTSSAGPSFSDGLTQDTVTMLQMLHEAQALVEGPLQLALQVYACKVAGKPLPLPHKQGAAFRAGEVAAALELLDKAEALELRCFLLQILCSCFARLPKYMEFLEAVKDQRWKSRYVPVEVQSAGKDNKQYALSRDFYAQACMAAAMPYDENAHCCSKHRRQRELAEADGGVFSRCTVDSPDDWKCVDVEAQTGAERTRILRRYILQAARVTEAQQQKELQPGTQQGLRALTKELFTTSEYDEKLPPVLTPDGAQPRGSWELCRFYLLLASQLAILREQLNKLVMYHEQNLDSHNLDAREMRQAERAVLQQRIAGMYFCYEAWAKWYTETVKVLQKDLEAATKAKGQDKAGKGAKDSSRDAQGKSKSADKLHAEIEKANNHRQAMQDGLRQLLKQSDMCAASASAMTTSLTDAERGLQQTLELVVRELINAKPAPESLQAGGLRKALQLSRMMLFELDVTIMQYVNAAHYAVLGNMWRFRQPAAAVCLVRYALGQRVLAKISEHKVNMLIEAEESTKQQAAAGKPAGKKKKKKGPAVQQKKISVHTSDNEASDEEKEETAAAAAEESEGEDAVQQQQPDAVQLLDPRFLAQLAEDDAAAAAEPASRSSGSGRAAGTAVCAAVDAAARAAEDSGGEFKPVGRAGAAAAIQQQQGRGQPPPQQQQRGKTAQSSSSSSSALGGFRLVDGFWRGPGPLGECAFPAHDSGQVGTICWECGHQGHVPANCTTPTCGKCGHMGHATADCRDACPECFRRHLPPPGGRHFLHCEKCSLFGHVAKFCPRSQCHSCGMYGHPSFQCRFCSQCRKQGHRAVDCNAKQCSVCGQWGTGCIPGHCINAAAVSSSSRAAQPRPAAPSSSSSRGSVKPPAAVIPMPQNVALLNAAQVQQLPQERRDELVNQLFGCGLYDIAGQLFEEQDKLTELMRVPAAVMQQWLEQPDSGSYVQGMLDHFARTKAGAKKEQQERQRQREQQEREPQQRDQREQQGPLIQPSQLPDAAAALFEAEYLPRAVPGDWRSLSWSRLSDIMNRNGRDRDRFRRARDAACAAAAAAGVTAAAPVRRSSSGVEQQQQQPQRQQQQQQRFGGEPSGPRESSSSDAANRDAAGEGAALYDGPHSALPLPQQQQQQQDHAAAAAAGAAVGPRPTPQNAMAAILADKRKKLGAQAVPAHLQPHLQQQQQPGGVSNSYSMPNPQLLQQQQQQQQQAGVMLPVDPAVAEADRRISSEPLAPWMLWYSMGASRAVHELPESEEKHQLLQVMSRDMSGTYMDLEQFGADVVEMLHRKNKMGATTAAAAADMAAWRQLGQLIVQARDLGHPLQQQQQQQFPAPAPTPAAAAAAGGPMLPPHLRGRGGLPPHLQQQQPQQQEDEDSDDDDTLLGMLGVDNTPASADGGASTWQSITGHAPEDATTSGTDFPPLGSQPVSAEDADMARAIAASRANHVPGVSAAGLANQAGEYNCFLNVVVQCLWSCKEFTLAVRNLADHECSHPVVQALLNLFERMEAAESGWKPGQVRAVIDPSELRVALAQHTHFKCQEMNDANELLDTIYECFAQSQAPGETQGSRGILIDGVFGLLLSEKVVCRSCGKETHKVPQHYEHLVVVNSTSLSMLYLMGQAVGMDNLLREMFDQEMKMCDKDEGGCGEPNPRYRELAMNPQVLTLQLVWDQNVSGDEIRNTLSQVEERLDITRMYNDLAVGDVTFRLTSAVAYYGQHYMAFVWNTTHNKWMMLDDANASLVGSWQDVINKCQAGKIQPGVLFYRLMDLSSIPDEAAPVQQQQQQLAPPVVHVPSSSSNSSASHYGAPGLGHHPGANAAAAPSHGVLAAMPAAAPAAAAASSSSGLPATSNWGARGRVPSQQPPAAAAASGPPSTGTPWGGKIMAAAGFDDADMAGAAPLYPLADTGDSWTYDKVESQQDSGSWIVGASGSGSFSSTVGPPGAPSRLSGSGDGYAASPARSHPTATGSGAAAAGAFGPTGRLVGSVMRDVLGQQGPVGTGPRSASTGPGGLDRNGSGSNAAPGAYAGGRGGGRAGSRGPGMGRGVEESEWGRAGGRGRGRGRGY